MKSMNHASLRNQPSLFASWAVVALLSFSSPIFSSPSDWLMGKPSNATTDPANRDDFLMDKPYFTLSYNNSKGTPNWVSWRLVAEDIGPLPRQNPFHPDPELPAGFTAVVPNDYSASGFDRGHMCNFKDRSSARERADATFVMTNMVPQSKHLNEQTWEHLEEYCRKLALGGKHLYIVSGPAGHGGESEVHRQPVDQIGTKHQVTVPSQCWKVILVVDGAGNDDLKKVDKNTRLIAIIMPNNESLDKDWAGFRVPVIDVEELTGYKFFTNVPDSVIEPLKAKVDSVAIHP